MNSNQYHYLNDKLEKKYIIEQFNVRNLSNKDHKIDDLKDHSIINKKINKLVYQNVYTIDQRTDPESKQNNRDYMAWSANIYDMIINDPIDKRNKNFNGSIVDHNFVYLVENDIDNTNITNKLCKNSCVWYDKGSSKDLENKKEIPIKNIPNISNISNISNKNNNNNTNKLEKSNIPNKNDNDNRLIRLWLHCPGRLNTSTDINPLLSQGELIPYLGPFNYNLDQTSGLEVPDKVIVVLSTKELIFNSIFNIDNFDKNFKEYEKGCELLIVGGPKYLPYLIDNNYDNMAKYIYFIDMKYLIIPEKSNKIDIFDKYKSIIIRGSNASGMMKYTY